MEFKSYQEQAKQTIQSYVDSQEIDEFIPFLGMIGEVGSVISELKKKIRDGDGYDNFKDQLKEELGDVLWYISTIASRNNIELEEIAKSNLVKTIDRFSDEDFSSFKTYDESYPIEERFQREFEITFVETTVGEKTTVEIKDVNGNRIGDPITDNSYNKDGYRYHDIFHFGYVAFLAWSPVIRKLMKVKRKSDDQIDEIEDGARAAITEELVSLYIYNYAQNHQLFKYSDRVDTEVLKTIKKLVSGIEVHDCTLKQWETAIISSYQVFEKLIKNKGGRVLVSIKNRNLLYIGKN